MAISIRVPPAFSRQSKRFRDDELFLPALVALIPLLMTPGLLFHYYSLPKVALLVLAMSMVLMRPGRVARDPRVMIAAGSVARRSLTGTPQKHTI
jgi:hypothetical protein